MWSVLLLLTLPLVACVPVRTPCDDPALDAYLDWETAFLTRTNQLNTDADAAMQEAAAGRSSWAEMSALHDRSSALVEDAAAMTPPDLLLESHEARELANIAFDTALLSFAEDMADDGRLDTGLLVAAPYLQDSQSLSARANDAYEAAWATCGYRP